MREVDIIIPTRNRAEKLLKCLNSIPKTVAKTKINVIVICDADTATARWLVNYKRIDRLIFVREHSGPVHCRNLATQTAEDMVLYAVDDMEFSEGCIENAVKAMHEHFPDGDGVIGLWMENRVIKKVKTGYYAGVALVGQKFLRRYPDKKLFFPEYFLFAAQEVTNLAVKLGKIRMAEDARFAHHAPRKSGNGVDKTHLDGRKWKLVDRGLRKKRSMDELLWGDNNHLGCAIPIKDAKPCVNNMKDIVQKKEDKLLSVNKTVEFIVQIYLDMDFPQLPQSEDWVKERLEFFQKFTLRSLQNQTFPDFRIFLLCGKTFKHITSKWALPNKVEVVYDNGRQKYQEIDSDYVSITRIDSDDMYHKLAMENIKDNLILSSQRECLIFRVGWSWERANNYLLERQRPSPPFYTHIFPKTMYRNWQQFQAEHFMGHGKAGGRLPTTRILQKFRHCVIKHATNAGAVNKGLVPTKLSPAALMALKEKFGDKLILESDRVKEILLDYGMTEENFQ